MKDNYPRFSGTAINDAVYSVTLSFRPPRRAKQTLYFVHTATGDRMRIFVDDSDEPLAMQVLPPDDGPECTLELSGPVEDKDAAVEKLYSLAKFLIAHVRGSERAAAKRPTNKPKGAPGSAMLKLTGGQVGHNARTAKNRARSTMCTYYKGDEASNQVLSLTRDTVRRDVDRRDLVRAVAE